MNVHGILGQCVFVDQFLQGFHVQGTIHDLIQFIPHLGLIPVTDGGNQQIPEGLILEGDIPKYIEYLTAEGIPFFFQLFKQALVDATLAGLLGYQIPKVAYLRLANSMNTTKPLLYAVRIPGQIIIDHQMRAL